MSLLPVTTLLLCRPAARFFFLPMTLLLLGLSRLTYAATLNVPTLAYPTIQSAVDASHNGDTVLIADGTYTGNGNRDIDFKGKNITVTSQNGPTKTIIDCQADRNTNHRGFYLHSGETSAVISGLTIENGYESNDNGGGILNAGSGLTVQYCTIKDNIVVGNYSFGGGVYNINGNGPIVLKQCTFLDNTASYGGGLCNRISNNSGPITLTDCKITGNIATVACSGVYNVSYNFDANGGTSSIIMTNCTVTSNISINGGGGIDNESDNSDSTIILAKCIVTGNTAYFGGGVFNENDGGTINLDDCTIATNGGGGVFNDSSNTHGKTILSHCAITGNTSGGGIGNNGSMTNLINCTIVANVEGGIFNDNGGTLTLTDCTIAKNTALGTNYYGGYGGGILNGPYNNVITLTNCTITDNSATEGGGIFNDGGTVTLTNDILTGNAATSGNEIFVSHGKVAATFCDIQGGYAGNGNINVDPLFVNAVISDYHLRPSSPCVGKGISNAPGYLPYAEDYQPRPNPPSIGAFEVKTARLVITNLAVSRSGGTVSVTVIIQNFGNATAGGVQVIHAKLDTATAATPLPGPYVIPAGSVQAIHLTFTTSETGRKQFSLQGTSSGPSFSAGVFLIVP